MDTDTAPQLTAPQLTLLANVAEAGKLTSRQMHTGTTTKLTALGLVRIVDRFPSGTALYAITVAGKLALKAAQQ